MQTSAISGLPAAWQRPAIERANAVSGVHGTSAGGGAARQSVMRLIAAEVLGALTQADGGLRGLAARGSDQARTGAGAVAQALKGGIAQGADPEVLLGKVQEGMANAQAALVDQGLDPSRASALATQFTDQVARLMDRPVSDPGAMTGEAVAASVELSRKERGSLVLTTQDGDVLRIRFRNSERQSIQFASASTPEAQATSVQLSASERSRTRVEVDGALDAGELKAIEDFVAKVDTLANEFFEGDVEAAFAAASALDYDASEIAGFSLKLSMSERVQASAVQRSFGGSADVPGMPPPPVPTSAGSAPVATAPSAAAAAPADTTQPTPAAQGGSTDPLRTVQDFVRRVLSTADAPISVGGFKLAWSVKVKIAAEVVSVAAPAAAEKPGGALLGKVLDSVAEQAGAAAPRPKLAAAA